MRRVISRNNSSVTGGFSWGPVRRRGFASTACLSDRNVNGLGASSCKVRHGEPNAPDLRTCGGFGDAPGEWAFVSGLGRGTSGGFGGVSVGEGENGGREGVRGRRATVYRPPTATRPRPHAHTQSRPCAYRPTSTLGPRPRCP
jgi:hypothetical protein